MEFQNYWYALVLIVMAVITMFLFVKKTIVFFTELKYMLPAIIFSGAIFILFNHRLLETGILSFNSNFLTGKYLFSLPVEEWLFLLIISLFSFSVYILITVLFPNFERPNLFLVISVVLLLGFGLVAWHFRQKLIPFFIFFLLTIYFGYTIFRNRFKMHLTKFYISYAIAVIPYFLIKGLLYSLPVISYNTGYTLGIRLLGTPVEEFGYFFLLMLINVTIFEYLKGHRLY
ncbi:MAG: lycopene cyclase domain-containing [Prolixibacteraceae bacterium]|nr:MAG: lycopene cyclase domain-containing [Prolixibacteraceae bacterium]